LRVGLGEDDLEGIFDGALDLLRPGTRSNGTLLDFAQEIDQGLAALLAQRFAVNRISILEVDAGAPLGGSHAEHAGHADVVGGAQTAAMLMWATSPERVLGWCSRLAIARESGDRKMAHAKKKARIASR
jgi:hypothetical protein